MLLSAGCKYESPLTSEQAITVDPVVIGLWENTPSAESDLQRVQRLAVFKHSEREYMIHHSMGDVGFYYRAYPIELGGVSCVQLQVLGSHQGAVKESEKRRFHVLSYQVADDELTVQTLNADLVDDGLKTEAALQAAFLQHKDHQNLFENPLTFSRVL